MASINDVYGNWSISTLVNSAIDDSTCGLPTYEAYDSLIQLKKNYLYDRTGAFHLTFDGYNTVAYSSDDRKQVRILPSSSK